MTLDEELLRLERVVEPELSDGRRVLQLVPGLQQLVHDRLDLAALVVVALDHLEVKIGTSCQSCYCTISRKATKMNLVHLVRNIFLVNHLCSCNKLYRPPGPKELRPKELVA